MITIGVWRSTSVWRTGKVDYIHPCPSHRCRSPNSNSYPFFTPSRHVVLHKVRKTFALLCIQLMMSTLKKGFTSKYLSHYLSKWPMWRGHVAMDCLRELSSPKYSQTTRKKFLVLWRISCVVVTTCTRWSSSSPASSLERKYCSITKMTWTHISCWCAFAIPEDAGGVRRGAALWERPGQVFPRCGPGVGLGRRTLGGRDYSLRRSGRNPLVARFFFAYWGSSIEIVAVQIVWWGRLMHLLPEWHFDPLKLGGTLLLSPCKIHIALLR